MAEELRRICSATENICRASTSFEWSVMHVDDPSGTKISWFWLESLLDIVRFSRILSTHRGADLILSHSFTYSCCIISEQNLYSAEDEEEDLLQRHVTVTNCIFGASNCLSLFHTLLHRIARSHQIDRINFARPDTKIFILPALEPLLLSQLLTM